MPKTIVDNRSLAEIEEEINNIIEMEKIEELKPLEVLNQEEVIKIKVNKNIDRELMDKINDTVQGLLVIEELKIDFDLIGVNFRSEEIETEFNRLIKEIKVKGGEVRKITEEL